MVFGKDTYIGDRAIAYSEYFFTQQNPADALKPWTRHDIDRFCKDDPVHGNQVKALRGAGWISGTGGLLGGVAGASYAFSNGGTLNGRIISATIGGIGCLAASFLVSNQVAVFTHGLYKFDKKETTAAFRDWWRKNGGAQ